MYIWTVWIFDNVTDRTSSNCCSCTREGMWLIARRVDQIQIRFTAARDRPFGDIGQFSRAMPQCGPFRGPCMHDMHACGMCGHDMQCMIIGLKFGVVEQLARCPSCHHSMPLAACVQACKGREPCHAVSKAPAARKIAPDGGTLRPCALW